MHFSFSYNKQHRIFYFLIIPSENPVGLLEKSQKNVRTLLILKPPPHPPSHSVFISQACPVIWQTQLEWSYQDWLPEWTSTPGKPVSLILGVVMCADFSFMTSKKVAAFQLLLLLLLFGWENERTSKLLLRQTGNTMGDSYLNFNSNKIKAVYFLNL